MNTLINPIFTKKGKVSLFLPILTLCLMVGSSGLSAGQTDEKKAGTVAASFLQVNPSVRMAALGGDQVAASGNFSALFSNPASLTTLLNPELWITQNQSFMDTDTSSLGFGGRWQDHALGILAQYIDRGEHDRTQMASDGTIVTNLGQFNNSTTLLHAGWARNVQEKISVGLGVKGWDDRLDGTTQNGWAADGGLLFKSLLPSFDVGLAAKNVGPDVDGFSLPTSGTLGAAYHFNHGTSLFSEMDWASHRDATFRAGAEYHRRYFWLRGGYQNLTQEVGDSLGNFSFGGGLSVKGWKVDYAWVPKGDLGDQHRVALSIGFGLSPEQRARAARELDNAMARRVQAKAQDHFEVGETFLKKGQWKEAADEFSNALTWNPDHAEARAQHTVAEGKLSFKRAGEHYQKGLQFSRQGRWLDTAVSMNQTLKWVPSHKKAKALLKKANRKIKNARTQSDAAFNKGVIQFLDGRYDTALTQWNKVLKTNPKHPYLFEYMEKAKRMKAEADLKALKDAQASPAESIDNLSRKAYTLFKMNQTEKAIETWRKVLLIDPKNAEAHEAIQKASAKHNLLKGRDTGRAVTEIDTLQSEAMSAYLTGNLGKAQKLLRRALLMSPQDSRIKNNLSRIKNELDNQNE
jgi:tetratricopeptide (TPR) repeat protein